VHVEVLDTLFLINHVPAIRQLNQLQLLIPPPHTQLLNRGQIHLQNILVFVIPVGIVSFESINSLAEHVDMLFDNALVWLLVGVFKVYLL